MLKTILALVFILTALIATATLNRKAKRASVNSHRNRTPRYAPTTYLCSTNELAFFHVLRRTFPNHTIMAKVRLSDVIQPADHHNYQSAFNKITSKHLDFLLCHPNTLEIICAIELDDATHTNPKRQQRDQFLNEALRTAKVILHRIPAHPNYSHNEIAALITSPPKATA